jgi:hypothetical protein
MILSNTLLIILRTQYGLHQAAVALCYRQGMDEKWRSATFWVFDAPQRNEGYEVTLLLIISYFSVKSEISARKERRRNSSRFCETSSSCSM